MSRLWITSVLLTIIFMYETEGFKSLWSWSPESSKAVSEQCGKWWEKAVNYRQENHEISKREYIRLIQMNCPGLLTVYTKATAKFPHKQQVEICHTQQVFHSLTHESIIVHKYEAHELCADNDGGDGDCYFWWSTARWGIDKANVRYDCVNQIVKHCPNLISKVHREKKIVHINGKSAHEITETYGYKGQQEQVVVIKYAPVHMHNTVPECHSTGGEKLPFTKSIQKLV